jgi:hypothetical protein
MASASIAAARSSSVRGPPLPGLSRRHHQLGARGQRRAHPRSIVQVPPAARAAQRGQSRCQRAGAGARADRSVPNVRADVVPVSRLGHQRGQHPRRPRADRLAVLNHLAPFLPVGFYYKAFHSKRWFPRWERMFRRLSGLGSSGSARPAPAITPSATIFATCSCSAPGRRDWPPRCPAARAGRLGAAGG